LTVPDPETANCTPMEYSDTTNCIVKEIRISDERPYRKKNSISLVTIDDLV
jgi:hypothetical protein